MNPSFPRISSVDILRGLVMIIMALDHTRDFFHITAMTADPLDEDTTTLSLYFTRWITNYCAPVFVFLSGLSAYLSSRKKTTEEASIFLFKRGLWLILAEVVIVTFGLTFNPLYHVIVLQVIWAIGCSMIILGILIRISFKAVLITGLILLLGHNILDYLNVTSNVWKVLFTALGTIVPITNTRFLLVLYAILPWTSAMLLGYCVGHYFKQDIPAATRKRFLLIAGSTATALFILLRSINKYGNPVPWEMQKDTQATVLDFLDVSKYPPSLDYLCMTLGPALLLLLVFENAKGKWQEIVKVYGTVPFFYYVVHFYLLHFLMVIIFFVSGYTTKDIVDPDVLMLFRPATFGYSLPVVYLIWILVVAFLYRPCQWFARYKKTHTNWWLKYF
ncbi:DUF1624 domain-containing protein [Chitinophaga sp. S165]|uniref:DUF1624 domain-containing protein n=1 Tax=Chitinophaga sp. S165 TaxID=2135462 RepID=UPI000D71519E|nr:heparan-alpha-glucosaminide N-acetyltransferase domain-containing protein [Chitinophaga sp. S165]PWV53333.1 putative membrane protein [Chitinophaga sp. S165]